MLIALNMPAMNNRTEEPVWIGLVTKARKMKVIWKAANEYNSKPNSHCLNEYSVFLAERVHLTAEKFEKIRQGKIPFLLHKTSQH